MNEWIDISTQLPPVELMIERDILIYLNNGGYGAGVFHYDRYGNIERMRYNGTTKHLSLWLFTPTHWMDVSTPSDSYDSCSPCDYTQEAKPKFVAPPQPESPYCFKGVIEQSLKDNPLYSKRNSIVPIRDCEFQIIHPYYKRPLFNLIIGLIIGLLLAYSYFA